MFLGNLLWHFLSRIHCVNIHHVCFMQDFFQKDHVFKKCILHAINKAAQQPPPPAQPPPPPSVTREHVRRLDECSTNSADARIVSAGAIRALIPASTALAESREGSVEKSRLDAVAWLRSWAYRADRNEARHFLHPARLGRFYSRIDTE